MGTAWHDRGHDVTFGVRNPDDPRHATNPLSPDFSTLEVMTAGPVSELGFEAVDAGDLILARRLEPYALLWIHLALRRGFGTDFGFRLLRGRA